MTEYIDGFQGREFMDRKARETISDIYNAEGIPLSKFPRLEDETDDTARFARAFAKHSTVILDSDVTVSYINIPDNCKLICNGIYTINTSGTIALGYQSYLLGNNLSIEQIAYAEDLKIVSLSKWCKVVLYQINGYRLQNLKQFKGTSATAIHCQYSDFVQVDILRSIKYCKIAFYIKSGASGSGNTINRSYFNCAWIGDCYKCFVSDESTSIMINTSAYMEQCTIGYELRAGFYGHHEVRFDHVDNWFINLLPEFRTRMGDVYLRNVKMSELLQQISATRVNLDEDYDTADNVGIDENDRFFMYTTFHCSDGIILPNDKDNPFNPQIRSFPTSRLILGSGLSKFRMISAESIQKEGKENDNDTSGGSVLTLGGDYSEFIIERNSDKVSVFNVNKNGLVKTRNGIELGNSTVGNANLDIKKGGVIYGRTPDTNAQNNMIFVNSSNNKLQFKDNSGIIHNILKDINYFSRERDMIVADLKENEICEINDIYRSRYIVTVASTEYSKALDNGLYATLITSSVNPKQFGAVGTGDTDDTEAIKKTIAFAQYLKLNRIDFTEGTYRVSETLVIPNTISIHVSGLCKISSTITNGAIINFTVDKEANIKNVYLVHGEGKLYVHSEAGRNSQYVIGVKISGTNYCNVHIMNTTVNNCYVGMEIEPKNVWNITIENCTFFYNTWGYFYGSDPSHTSGTSNAGERICFKDCVFTQNLIDNTYFGLTWSQTNYHNCSFDMSNCVFFMPRNDTLGWDAGSLKISCSQCHFEGIGINISDIVNYDKEKGIFYMDGTPYATILSITDSTFAISAKYPLFYCKEQMNASNYIILDNVFTLPSTDTLIDYPFLSKNCNIKYSNLTYRGEPSTIDGNTNVLMRTLVPSIDSILNPNPMFENLEVKTYTSEEYKQGSIIGNYEVEESTAVKSIQVVDNTTYSVKGKKIVMNFDTTYSEKWNSTFSLIGKDMIRVNGGETIIAQPLVTALSRGDIATINRQVNVNIIEYDDDKNKITNQYLRMVTKENTEKVQMLLGIPILLNINTRYISYNITITNGLKDNVYPTRDLEGIFIYKL